MGTSRDRVRGAEVTGTEHKDLLWDRPRLRLFPSPCKTSRASARQRKPSVDSRARTSRWTHATPSKAAGRMVWSLPGWRRRSETPQLVSHGAGHCQLPRIDRLRGRRPVLENRGHGFQSGGQVSECRGRSPPIGPGAMHKPGPDNQSQCGDGINGVLHDAASVSVVVSAISDGVEWTSAEYPE